MISDVIHLYKIPLGLGISALILMTVGIVAVKTSPGDSGYVTIVESHTEEDDTRTSYLIVDIQGAVENPGVYEMAEGSRLSDLIESAGGLSEFADEDQIARSINRAQPLIDGVKIYIPDIRNTQETVSTESKEGSNHEAKLPININTATDNELESLPGVGEKTAQKIIDGRPYGSVGELREKKIVGAKVFGDIEQSISTF